MKFTTVFFLAQYVSGIVENKFDFWKICDKLFRQ